MTVSATGGGAVTVGGTLGVGAVGDGDVGSFASELPMTGSPVQLLLLLALVVLVAGVVLLGWDRRHGATEQA